VLRERLGIPVGFGESQVDPDAVDGGAGGDGEVVGELLRLALLF
jgi:hypothetical protein